MREVPNWDEHFLNGCLWASGRSKDPNTQVGCIIVDANNHVIATGYNGMPPGLKETKEIWSKPFKYQYVAHAEQNAISHATTSLVGSTAYINIWPCQDCARLLACCKIKRVVIGSDHYRSDKVIDLFTRAGIIFERYDREKRECINLMTTNP